MLTSLLNPNEEANLRFYRLTVPILSFIFVIICTIVISISLLTAPHDYTDIPKDNYPNATHDYYLTHPVRRKNMAVFLSEQEKNQEHQNQTYNFNLYLRDHHYKSIGMKRIQFGDTYDTYCWDDSPVPTSWLYLPSILRVFEFRPLVQSAFRFAILFTASPRLVLSFFRSAKIRALSTSTNIFVSKLIHLNYWVVAVEVISEFFVTALHQDCDRNYKHFMPYILVLLAVSSSLNMLLVIIEDIFDTTLRLTTCARFYIRVCCLLVSILVFPTVIDNHLMFLERKLCHPYVYWSAALPEYLVATALAVFILTECFDLGKINGFITSYVSEVSPEFYLDDYVPAVKYEKERVKPRICRTEHK